MTHDDAFLQDILASPKDESLRLIYADWLEDNGQGDRADFIRVQSDLARLGGKDPRRAALRKRERELLEGEAGRVARQADGGADWEDTMAQFTRRLAEAAAWCRRREVRALRTPVLEQQTLVLTPPSSGWSIPSAGGRQAAVHILGDRRAHLLAYGARPPRTPPHGLSRGRMLLFDPDGSLRDGAAARATKGYFDADNVPPWDTWVWYAVEANPQELAWRMWRSYLVAWVPRHAVGLVDLGVEVNPEQCIRWASDVDTSLTRRLRAAGLLA